MTSSLSPVEMTVDPTFVFNPDMGRVDNFRFADFEYRCGDNDTSVTAERVLELSDGRMVRFPSRVELSDLGMTEFEWLQSEGLTLPINAIIEQTSDSGEPVILVDNRDDLYSDAIDHWAGRPNLTDMDPVSDSDAAKACGCATGGSGAPAAVLLGLMLLGVRRKSE